MLTLSTMLEPTHRLICVQLCSTFMDSLNNPETRNTSRRKHTRNWKYSKSEYFRVQHSHRPIKPTPTTTLTSHPSCPCSLPSWADITPLLEARQQHARAQVLRCERNDARLTRDRPGSPAGPRATRASSRGARRRQRGRRQPSANSKVTPSSVVLPYVSFGTVKTCL